MSLIIKRSLPQISASPTIIKRVISTLVWSSKLNKPYAKDLNRKAVIEKAVVDYAKNNGVDDLGAEIGEILSTEHSGGTDPNEPNHVTVEYKDANGKHITTKHVKL